MERTGAEIVTDEPTDEPDREASPPAHPSTVAVFIAHLEPGTFTNLGSTLVKAFIAQGVAAELVVVRATREELASVPGVPVRVLGASRTLFAALPLARYLRTHRPGILLPMTTYPNFVALLAAKLARVPECRVVITEHNVMSREMERYPRRSLRRWAVGRLVSRLYPGCAGFVGVSRDVVDDPVLNRLYDVRRNPHAAIHNPIPSNERRAGDQVLHPWLRADRMTPTLVAIGALVRAKGFDDLIQAMALLRDSGSQARLVILGEGSLREPLERQVASLGLDEHIALPGFVRDPLPYLRACDAFVLSSRWEGNPLAMLEAMSCGCPIVATACVSGVTDVIQHGRNGLLVPVGDPPALAGALSDILSDRPLAERLAASARETSAQFDPLRVAQEYIAFFERVRGNAEGPVRA